jgi:hypothetical protein
MVSMSARVSSCKERQSLFERAGEQVLIGDGVFEAQRTFL